MTLVILVLTLTYFQFIVFTRFNQTFRYNKILIKKRRFTSKLQIIFFQTTKCTTCLAGKFTMKNYKFKSLFVYLKSIKRICVKVLVLFWENFICCITRCCMFYKTLNILFTKNNLLWFFRTNILYKQFFTIIVTCYTEEN